MEQKKMTGTEMWKQFCRAKEMNENIPHTMWSFGDAPDKLAKLVLEGIKRGTASALTVYEFEKEPVPVEGAYSVILNSQRIAQCVIQTIRVEILPFCEVNEEHARIEGEGDKSLEYWQKVHLKFFTEKMEQIGLEFSEQMQVVFEEFAVVHS